MLTILKAVIHRHYLLLEAVLTRLLVKALLTEAVLTRLLVKAVLIMRVPLTPLQLQ